MKIFSDEDMAFLMGTKFSNGREFQVVKSNELVLRIPYLVNLSKNKSVLHIGFTDHIPLIEKKHKSGTWLHGQLIESCQTCWGIDIDREAVDFVKDKLSISNVFSLNIQKDELPEEFTDRRWDYVILGEVLEHIDNPVEFLGMLREKLKGTSSKIIVTVPNAWDAHNLMRIEKGIEFINTDHRYWFTAYTLTKVLSRAGFSIQEVKYVQSFMPETWWLRRQIRKFPLKRETILAIASFEN